MQGRTLRVEATHRSAQQSHVLDVRPQRRLPVGADVLPGGGGHVRVWAPQRQGVEVVLEGGLRYSSEGGPAVVALEPEGTGYFSGLVGEAAIYPAPASRFQPQGPHGPSQVIDPGAFPWQDQDWRGVPLEGQVLYE